MSKGDLKFKSLAERKIQIFGQTNLVTKNGPHVGVTVSFGKKQAATQGGVDGTTNFTEDSHSTYSS